MADFKFILSDLVRIAQNSSKPVIVRRNNTSIAYSVVYSAKCKRLVIEVIDTFKYGVPYVSLLGDKYADVCADFCADKGTY